MKNEYDHLKVMAILLVVVGHITNRYHGATSEEVLMHYATTGIYLFHMPLFIALSGAIYSIGIEKGKYSEFAPFAWNKVKRLLIPFLGGGIFLAPVLFLTNFTEGSLLDIAWKILMCDGTERHLWYLPVLFWIFLMVWGMKRIKTHTWLMFLISLIALCVIPGLFTTPFFRLPLSFHSLPYFVLGMMLNEYKGKSGMTLVYGCVGAVLFAVVGRYVSVEPFDTALKELLRCSFVVIIICGTRLLMPIRTTKLSQYILKQSFGIYLFHILFIYALAYFWGDVLNPLVMLPLAFVVSVVGSCVVTEVVRRIRLSFIIGEY